MCRWILLASTEPVLLADVLTRPAHSIINQSFDSRLRIDLQRPLNGDGFGVGWYDLFEAETSETDNVKNDSDSSSSPCLFTSILPAWNNPNLNRICEKIRTRHLFAHVRAASPGLPITETNCHPFQYKSLMWMHNGYIGGFKQVKRELMSLVKDEFFLFVQGSTDSEWSFALFLDQLENPSKGFFTDSELRDAMFKTIEIINKVTIKHGIKEISLLNFAVSDGRTVICCRYINDLFKEPASLYYSCGTKFEQTRPEHYRMVKDDRKTKLVIVASEPLSFERSDWITVPRNTMITITKKMNVKYDRIPVPENRI